MKTCPACRESIDVAATRCAHCHTAFDELAMRAGRAEHRRMTMLKFAAVLIGLVVFAFWVAQP